MKSCAHSFAILAIMFLLAQALIASDHSNVNDRLKVREIKVDPAYLYGEGSDTSRANAVKAADDDLLSKIQVSISVSHTGHTSETVKGDSLDLDKVDVWDRFSFTGMRLKGLDHVVVLKDGVYQALAYITQQGLQESLDSRKSQIRDLIVLGQAAEDECRLGDALKNYYWAYLLANTYPDTVTVSFEGVTCSEPLVALPQQISRLISRITVNATDVYKDGSVVVAELEFVYGERLVRGLNVHYYSGLATDYAQVWNGNAVLPIYDEPSFPERQLVLSVDYVAEAEMSVNKEIASLHKIFKDRELPNTLTVQLRFPWLAVQERKVEESLTRAPEPRQDIPASESEVPEAPKAEELLTQAPEPQQDSPVDEPEIPVEVYPVEEMVEHPDHLIVLASLHDADDFLRILTQYRKLGQIDIGVRDDFEILNGCYVAVIDNLSVWGVFLYDGNGFTEISSGRKLTRLTDEFLGKRQIWIKSTD